MTAVDCWTPIRRCLLDAYWTTAGSDGRQQHRSVQQSPGRSSACRGLDNPAFARADRPSMAQVRLQPIQAASSPGPPAPPGTFSSTLRAGRVRRRRAGDAGSAWHRDIERARSVLLGQAQPAAGIHGGTFVLPARGLRPMPGGSPEWSVHGVTRATTGYAGLAPPRCPERTAAL